MTPPGRDDDEHADGWAAPGGPRPSAHGSALPPPPPDGDNTFSGFAPPTPGTAGQYPIEETTGPPAPPVTGRPRGRDLYAASRSVEARWETLERQRREGDGGGGLWRTVTIVGLVISALALIGGGVLIARGVGATDGRIDATVPVGSTASVTLTAGEYDIAVEGRGLLRNRSDGSRRTGPLTTTIAFEPPQVDIVGPNGPVALASRTGQRTGVNDRQRALVYGFDAPSTGTYTITVGEWHELSPQIRSVIIGESPLLVSRSTISGIVMLVAGFVGLLTSLVAMAIGTLAGRRRRGAAG